MDDIPDSLKSIFYSLLTVLTILGVIGEFLLNQKYLHIDTNLIILAVGGYLS